uniref:Uncharacterized protein n=1 Tax=Glossina austeni TaxID=7395 RepID=A0A1A9UGF6_GLOAU
MSCSNLYLLYNEGNTRDVAKVSEQNQLDLACSGVNNLEGLELYAGILNDYRKSLKDNWNKRILKWLSCGTPEGTLILFNGPESKLILKSSAIVTGEDITSEYIEIYVRLVIGMNVVISNTQQKPTFSCVTTKRSIKDQDLTSMAFSFIKNDSIITNCEIPKCPATSVYADLASVEIQHRFKI